MEQWVLLLGCQREKNGEQGWEVFWEQEWGSLVWEQLSAQGQGLLLDVEGHGSNRRHKKLPCGSSSGRGLKELAGTGSQEPEVCL